MNARRLHLLLVEDDPLDVFLTQDAFEAVTLIGSISTARDGLDALAFLRGEAPYEHPSCPDLILLDLNMPRMNGFEFLQEIKRDPQFRRIPVLVFSTSTAQEDIRQSYDCYANSYVPKPASHDQYQQVVQAVEQYWMTRSRLPHSAQG